MSEKEFPEYSAEDFEELVVWGKKRDERRAAARRKQLRRSIERQFGELLDEVDAFWENPDNYHAQIRFMCNNPDTEDFQRKAQAAELIQKVIRLTKIIMEPPWTGRSDAQLKLGSEHNRDMNLPERRRVMADAITSFGHLLPDNSSVKGINLWANELSEALIALKFGETQPILSTGYKTIPKSKPYKLHWLRLCALAWVGYYSGGQPYTISAYERVANAYSVSVDTVKKWKQRSRDALGADVVNEVLSNEDLICALDKYCWSYFGIPEPEESRAEVEYYGRYYNQFLADQKNS